MLDHNNPLIPTCQVVFEAFPRREGLWPFLARLIFRQGVAPRGARPLLSSSLGRAVPSSRAARPLFFVEVSA